MMKPKHVMYRKARRLTVGRCAWLTFGLLALPLPTMVGAQTRVAGSSNTRAIALVKEAEAAFLRGDYSRSLLLSRQATVVDPRYPRAYTWIGAVYEKRGEAAQAGPGAGRGRAPAARRPR